MYFPLYLLLFRTCSQQSLISVHQSYPKVYSIHLQSHQLDLTHNRLASLIAAFLSASYFTSRLHFGKGRTHDCDLCSACLFFHSMRELHSHRGQGCLARVCRVSLALGVLERVGCFCVSVIGCHNKTRFVLFVRE